MTRLGNDNQAGFTLIETLVALVVIAMSVAAVLTAFIAVESLNRRARNLTIATQAANQQLETYRNTAYAGIPTGANQDLSSLLTPYPSLGTPRSALATITEIDPAGLKQVDIAISYTESGKTKNVQVSTLIARRGINR